MTTTTTSEVEVILGPFNDADLIDILCCQNFPTLFYYFERNYSAERTLHSCEIYSNFTFDEILELNMGNFSGV
jgi:hypothetical protein